MDSDSAWRTQIFSLVYQATGLPVLLYGCESWVLTQDMNSKINSTSCYCIMLNIKRTDRVSNDEAYSKVGTGPLVFIVIQFQLRFLGHKLHRDTKEPFHLYALYIPPLGGLAENRQTSRNTFRNYWLTRRTCSRRCR